MGQNTANTAFHSKALAFGLAGPHDSVMAPTVSVDHRARRRNAFEHAALLHESAAALHHAAAMTFQRMGDSLLAQKERQLADKEAEAAKADRLRADRS